jgi:nitrate reductase NapA
MKLSRRDILKTGIAAGACAALGFPNKAGAQSAVKGSDVDRWVKGVCRFCGTGCGVFVGVKNGRVIAIKGNPDAKTNFGFLCVKGSMIPKFIYNPDRLTHPLIRNKDGVLERATWDKALTLITDKMKDYHTRFGKDSVAYYGSGQCTTEESYTFNKLWKGGFASNQVEGNPRLCMASAVAGYLTSFGSDEPSGTYADIENAKCFFLTGSNTSEAHPILFRRIWRRKQQDPSVKIIVCEPRKTKTSDIADLWLPVDPGTDLAVFQSMAYEIVKNGWVDKGFVEKCARITDGEKAYTLDEFKAHLEQFEASKIEGFTKCPAASVRKAAEWFAKSGASMSLWCMGLNQRSRGVWANNLIHNLHLLTGNIGRPGADSFSLTGQPNACGGVRETGSLSHLLPGCRPIVNPAARASVEKAWGLPEGSIDPKPGMDTVALFDNFGAENDATKPVKMVITSTTNPAHTLPNLHKYLPRLKAGFLVTIDIFPTRTTQFADVILPAAFLYEKGGVYGCSERRSQLTEKAINPPGEAKSDLWIAAQIAKRMGYEKLIPWNMDDNEKAGELAWTDYITCTKDTEKTLFGATYRRLKASLEGFQWPCPSEDHAGTYKRYVRGDDPIFERPANKEKIPADAQVYFYSDGKGEGKANIFMRAYAGGAEVPDAEYPFFLTTGRVVEQWHTSTMTGRVPEIARSHPNAYVEIHSRDAARLNVKSGDMVELTSRRGKSTLPARVVDTAVPGVLFVPMHDQERNRLINFVCNDAVDGASKEPEYKIAAVKAARVSGPVKVAPYLVTDVNEAFL